MVDCHLPLFPVHMKAFPALLAFHQKIGAEKGIAAYLKSDKRPSNFWGSDWLAGAQLLSALHSLLSWRLNRGWCWAARGGEGWTGASTPPSGETKLAAALGAAALGLLLYRRQ